MDSECYKKIVIVTSDEFKIPITKEVAEFSNIFKEMLSEDFIDDDTEDIQLPVSIRKELMDVVIEFIDKSIKDECVGKIDAPLPGNSKNFSSIDGVPRWAEEWLKNKTLLEIQKIIMCANFLDIKPLLYLCCAYIAYQIKGKTVDEIKNMFDYTQSLKIN